MLRQNAFFIVTILIVSYGLIFTLRYFGWPSLTERKHKTVRAIKTGLSSTSLLGGLILIYFYWSSPETFWKQWTIIAFIGGVLFFVIPVFVLMAITSFIQFSALDKMQMTMTNRLRKIGSRSGKDGQEPK